MIRRSITSPGVEAALKLMDLKFAFDSPGQRAQRLFEDFTQEFPAGRVTAVLGRSGSGKTTLLNLIAGTLTPQYGKIEFHAPQSNRKKPVVGMVLQSPTLVPWRTVLANVLLGVEITEGHTSNDARKAAEGYLTRSGLAEYQTAYPHQLSGGMQQRVSVVRAVLPSPDILLLDEPFSNLDFDARYKLQLELSDVIDARDAVVVFVTHDIEDALRFGDQILLIGDHPVRILDKFDITEPRNARLEVETFDAARLADYRKRIYAAWRTDAKSVS